jgi:dihydrodipicolinate synthase/N-acetylneuraminate lyase
MKRQFTNNRKVMDKANLKATYIHSLIPAMATPLNEEGTQLNLSGVPALVEFLIERGVSGLFAGGSTGEGILLGCEERMQLHQAVVSATDGRVPVLVHAGANTTADTLALARHGVEIGADAVVVVTPTYYPMIDADLAAYFRQVAAAIPDTPLFAYDIPQFAVNGISPALFRQLMEIPNFAGVKCSRPDAQIVRQHIDIANGNAIVLVGNESIALGTLALGADGMISGLATAVPEPFVALVAALARDDLAEARLIQRRINRILNLFPAGRRLGGIKAILASRGVPVGPVMPPRPMPAAGALWSQIEVILSEAA